MIDKIYKTTQQPYNFCFKNKSYHSFHFKDDVNSTVLQTRMWANAQRDGHPAKYREGPLFNDAKFG